MGYADAGRYLLNLSAIAYVDWHDGGDTDVIAVYFNGGAEPLRIDPQSDPGTFQALSERWEEWFMEPERRYVYLSSWPPYSAWRCGSIACL